MAVMGDAAQGGKEGLLDVRVATSHGVAASTAWGAALEKVEARGLFALVAARGPSARAVGGKFQKKNTCGVTDRTTLCGGANPARGDCSISLFHSRTTTPPASRPLPGQ